MAFYLGTFCSNLFLTVSVERIILGGGVLSRKILVEKIQQVCLEKINKYITVVNEENIKQVIVSPKIDNLGTLAAASCGQGTVSK